MNRQLQYNLVSMCNSRGVCRVLWKYTEVTNLSRLHKEEIEVVSRAYNAIRKYEKNHII